MNENINSIKFETDFLLIQSKENLFWLTNLPISYGFILLSKKGEKYAFFDERYFWEAKKKLKKITIKKIEEFSVFLKKLKGDCSFESNISWRKIESLKGLFSNLRFLPLEAQELRIIKNSNEIEKIKNICRITSEVWKKMKKKIKIGTSENDVSKMLSAEFGKLGVKEFSFNPIIAADERAFFIHSEATNKKIKEYVLCDFGGKLSGYCSDFTRVLFLKKNSEIKEKWELLKELTLRLMEKIKPGIKISDLIKFTDEFYKKNKIKQRHALGHGIGLEVHEKPDIFLNSEKVLKTGMVFTIEPGIYEEKLGGLRYENVILVTENGCENLTKS